MCRSIFCQDGYDFTLDSCERDNSTIDYDTSTSKCPDEMMIEFTVNNKYCLQNKTNPSQEHDCDSEQINSHTDLITSMHAVLSGLLVVNINRIENITLVCNL